jgi:hypothetical protein
MLRRATPMSMGRLLEVVYQCADELMGEGRLLRLLERYLRDQRLRTNKWLVHRSLGVPLKQRAADLLVRKVLNGNPDLRNRLVSLMDQRAPWEDVVAVLAENSDIPPSAAGSLLYVSGGVPGVQIAAYVQKLGIRSVLMPQVVVVEFYRTPFGLAHGRPFLDLEPGWDDPDFRAIVR